MKLKLRDVILKPADLRRTPVEVPEWPETKDELYMQELSEADFLQMQQDLLNQHPNRRARLAVKILVDGDGTPVLTEADATVLANQPAGPLAGLWVKWQEWIETLQADAKKKTVTTSPTQSGR